MFDEEEIFVLETAAVMLLEAGHEYLYEDIIDIIARMRKHVVRVKVSSGCCGLCSLVFSTKAGDTDGEKVDSESY